METTKSQVMESNDTLGVMDPNETIDPSDGLPRVRESRQQDNSEEGSGMIRRGLLYMLLAAVLYYFAGGYNPMEFPLNVIPPVLDIYLPLLFLGGLGMVLLAVIRRPPSEMEARGNIVEFHRRWRRREPLWYRAKIALGLGAFATLAWMTIQFFGK